MKIAYNIQWSIDMDEVYERLDSMPAEKAAEALGVHFYTYANMTTEERHDYAYDKFHHCPAELDEFIGLPEVVEIPENLADDEDISDWLSDKFGYCHGGFELKDVSSSIKGSTVWTIVPESTPAMARVFSNKEEAEKCFLEMLKEHGIGDCNNPAVVEEVLDTGYFRGHSQNRKDLGTYEYTLNSFVIE